MNHWTGATCSQFFTWQKLTVHGEDVSIKFTSMWLYLESLILHPFQYQFLKLLSELSSIVDFRSLCQIVWRIVYNCTYITHFSYINFLKDLPVEIPESFLFPFEPYDIQKGFMEQLYKALELGKIGIFESPTGTVSKLALGF